MNLGTTPPGWNRDYYTFGSDKDASCGGNDYKFTGKRQDNESGLYDFWHRPYDPFTGRFISVDPKWEKYPSLTPYQYCANNPLKYVDPDGMLIMSPSQQQAFIDAFENATLSWYAKYNKLNTEIILLNIV